MIVTFDDGLLKLFEWERNLEVVHTISKPSGFKKVVGNEEYLAASTGDEEVELYSLNELSSEPEHVFEVPDGEGNL